MKQKKIFISGSLDMADIRIRENYLAADAFLASKGYLILNPAVLPEDLPLEDLVALRMSMISRADAVVILRTGDQESDSSTDARKMETMYAACLRIKLYSRLESVE